jgi:hypothetical protein
MTHVIEKKVILGKKKTYSKLDGHREEVHASGLGDSVTAWNTGQVNKGRLCFALGTLEGLDHVLGKSMDIESAHNCDDMNCKPT